jgi:2-polyprenyl-3-methyl-5-hydroxy-6-metoxy-1,4-benzoquinol methylase
LDALVARVRWHPDLEALSSQCKIPRIEFSGMLETYCNEAYVGLRLIKPLLADGLRILEIGSGLGVLTHALASAGFEITGIEPGAAGFEFMQRIGALVRQIANDVGNARWLEIAAHELDPEKHGKFDLIFSTNVLEHIPDLSAAFSGMTSVLAARGLMIHLCPNYFIPYEPHFAIPLFPFFPRATRRLFPRRTKAYPGLWEELNFVTAADIRRLARQHELELSFDDGVMSAMLRRLNDDPIYRQRQTGIVTIAQRILNMTKLDRLIDRIPGRFATPMVMRLSHARSPHLK